MSLEQVIKRLVYAAGIVLFSGFMLQRASNLSWSILAGVFMSMFSYAQWEKIRYQKVEHELRRFQALFEDKDQSYEEVLQSIYSSMVRGSLAYDNLQLSQNFLAEFCCQMFFGYQKTFYALRTKYSGRIQQIALDHEAGHLEYIMLKYIMTHIGLESDCLTRAVLYSIPKDPKKIRLILEAFCQIQSLAKNKKSRLEYLRQCNQYLHCLIWHEESDSVQYVQVRDYLYGMNFELMKTL